MAFVDDNASRSSGARANTLLAEIASGARPAKAYSTIVLAGLVRLVEFLLLAGAGFGVHENLRRADQRP